MPFARNPGTRWQFVCSGFGNETSSNLRVQIEWGCSRMENAPLKLLSVPLCRLTWVLLGPVGLFLTAASMTASSGGWLTGKDLLFLGNRLL